MKKRDYDRLLKAISKLPKEKRYRTLEKLLALAARKRTKCE